MTDLQIPRLRMTVVEVPSPPLGPVNDWPLSRILQVAGYVGVMIAAMGTFPEPLNHFVPVILFGVTAVTIMIVNSINSCTLSYLETHTDLTYPRFAPTVVFALPPDLEQPRQVYSSPYPFDPIGVIA